MTASGRPEARCTPEERPKKQSVTLVGVWRTSFPNSPGHRGTTWGRTHGPAHAFATRADTCRGGGTDGRKQRGTKRQHSCPKERRCSTDSGTMLCAGCCLCWGPLVPRRWWLVEGAHAKALARFVTFQWYGAASARSAVLNDGAIKEDG